MGRRNKKHQSPGTGISTPDLQRKIQEALYYQQTGYLKRAEDIYQSILELIPNQPDCTHFLGMLYHQKEQTGLALQYLEKSIRINQNNPIYHNNYGLVLSRQDKTGAIAAYKKAIALKGDYAEAWYNLAVVHNDLGNLEEAERAYKEAVRIRPAYLKALYNLNCVQELLSRHEDAGKTVNQILAVTPDSAEAHNILGSVLMKLEGRENLKKAEYHFWEALQLRPDYLDAYINLGRLYQEGNHIEGAIKCFEKALELEPEYAEAIIELATALTRDEQISRAEKILSDFIANNHNHTLALIRMGDLRKMQGKFDTAEGLYHAALKINASESAAYIGLAGCRKYTADDVEFINNLKAASNNNASVNFAMGKVYNDLGDYDRSFSYYKKGNEIRNRWMDYDVNENSEVTEKNISVFTNNFIRRLQSGGNTTRLPVFILGTPRSGTTLTEQIISSHPEVYGAGELRYINEQIRKIMKSGGNGRKYPDCMQSVTPADISSYAADYLEKIQALCGQRDVQRITNKMPGNFKYIGYIACLFPNVKIIHCRRNPLDACLSIFFQSFISAHQYSFDLENLGHWYRDYLRLMEHWNQVLGNNIHNVEYADTVSNLEETARKLIDFCGLEWNVRCLEFHKSERSINTASVWQARQPIYKSSLERWKRYDKHIGVLKEILAGYY